MGGAQLDQLRGVSQHAPVIAGHRVKDQHESGRFGQPRPVPQLPPDGLRHQQSLPRLLELFLGAESWLVNDNLNLMLQLGVLPAPLEN